MDTNKETVDLILDRMKNAPEEFFSGSLKWLWLSNPEWHGLFTEEERGLLQKGLAQVRRVELKRKVLDSILSDGVKEDNPYITSYTGPKLSGDSGITFRNQTTPALQIGDTTLNQEDFARLKKLAAVKRGKQ